MRHVSAGTPPPVYRFAAAAAFAVMRVQRWSFHVTGAEHVPASGGAVIAANHIGFWDFFTVGRAPYRDLRRPVRILAKASLFDLPLLGAILRRAGQIPVERAAGSRAYAAAIDALRRGELLLVLPEQTISPSFELRAFKQGAARMAASAGVPLVPAVSWGSHRFHTIGHGPRPKWRLPVSVAYGEPLNPTRADDPARVTASLRERMRELLDTVQRSYPHGSPPGAWWVPERMGGGAPSIDDAERSLRRLTEDWRHRPRGSG